MIIICDARRVECAYLKVCSGAWSAFMKDQEVYESLRVWARLVVVPEVVVELRGFEGLENLARAGRRRNLLPHRSVTLT